MCWQYFALVLAFPAKWGFERKCFSKNLNADTNGQVIMTLLQSLGKELQVSNDIIILITINHGIIYCIKTLVVFLPKFLWFLFLSLFLKKIIINFPPKEMQVL